MSGTPVICSDKGACPEIITRDVGFVCRYEPDYLNAIRKVGWDPTASLPRKSDARISLLENGEGLPRRVRKADKRIYLIVLLDGNGCDHVEHHERAGRQ